jgi:NAD(P) transhydrogenase
MNFDLVVIGSGPGGQKAAIQASKLGKKVALIESRAELGGFCTHTGTIPSKTLKQAADLYKGMSRRVQNEEANLEFLKNTFEQMKITIEREKDIATAQLARNGVVIKHGHGKLLSAKSVKVRLLDGGEEILECEKIVLATGSRPGIPKGVEIEQPYYDSDSILTLDALPKSMIVEGGGVIGSEYACIFDSLGVDVTLVNLHASILHFLDEDIREALTQSMRDRGIDVRMNCKIKEYKASDTTATYVFEDGSSVSAEAALVCSSRQANIENLGLENVNIELNRGSIKVDSNYQSTEPGVYGVGDVNGFPCLAAAAMVHGSQAALHAFGKSDDFKEPLIPMGIYSIPEASSVGRTERQLKKDGVTFTSCSSNFTELARAQIDDTREGLLKILFDPKTLEIFGVHIMGRGACDLIHLGQAVMNLGGTLSYFKDNPSNFPTYSGAYKVAAINGLNQVNALDI